MQAMLLFYVWLKAFIALMRRLDQNVRNKSKYYNPVKLFLFVSIQENENKIYFISSITIYFEFFDIKYQLKKHYKLEEEITLTAEWADLQ